MKLVIHSMASWGGIVDYLVEQAVALDELGCVVILIVPKNFSKSLPSSISIVKALPDLEDNSDSAKWVRRSRWIFRLLKSWRIAAHETARLKPDALLLSAFSETLAPIWKGHISSLRHKIPGLKIAAVLHDPVRLPTGPLWFHRLSVKSAFAMLDAVFVHPPTDTSSLQIPAHTVPHGVPQFSDPQKTSAETRSRLNIPQDSTVLLAFGHIRDDKNLDFAIRALNEFSENVHLIVAGKVMSAQHRPTGDYRRLADTLGVSKRVTWLNRFIPEDEAAHLFRASDIVLLNYSVQFVSASGVLHLAVKFRKPVLASCGGGPLKWAVEKYQLGVWVEPDSLEALMNGFEILQNIPEAAAWAAYELENTWEENAERILSVLQRDPVGSSKR